MNSEKLTASLKELVEPVLEALGLEVLDLVYIPRRKRSLLRITIDKESGNVSIGDCEMASYRISRLLDVEDPIPGSFNLEVSSPGFKRLLRIPKDLPRFIHHRVKVKLKESLDGKRIWYGILMNDEDPMELGETTQGEKKIPWDNIVQINLDD